MEMATYLLKEQRPHTLPDFSYNLAKGLLGCWFPNLLMSLQP